MAHTLTSNTGNITSDPAATGSTIVERDPSGNSSFAGVIQAIATITGGMNLTVVTKSADFTADQAKAVYVVDNSAGNITCALPAAASSQNFVFIAVVLSSAHNFVINPNGSENVNGATTKTNAVAYSTALQVCDGTQWVGLLSGTWT